jgi:hypothetical protein
MNSMFFVSIEARYPYNAPIYTSVSYPTKEAALLHYHTEAAKGGWKESIVSGAIKTAHNVRDDKTMVVHEQLLD